MPVTIAVFVNPGTIPATKPGAKDRSNRSFEYDSLTELPEGLIKARIARGMTQKQLAESLNLQEQQIQRYEATLYKGAALERIEAVAKVLGLREMIRFELG